MRAAVHVDRAEGVRAADVEDVDALQLGQLDELDAVRREELPRDARRLAPRVRLELVALTICEERLRPRLERSVFQARADSGSTAPGSHTPFSVGVAPPRRTRAVGAARRRLRRTCLTAAARAALPRSATATGASFGHADLHARTFGRRLLRLLTDERLSVSSGDRNSAAAATVARPGEACERRQFAKLQSRSGSTKWLYRMGVLTG